jgi:hypothetical protein
MFLMTLISKTMASHNFSSLFCKNIPIPARSHFIGLDPPTDQSKWKEAIEKVCRGDLVLLKRVHERIHRHEDIYAPDKSYRWNHGLADILIHKKLNMMQEISDFPENRAPIVHFGRRQFQGANLTGRCNSSDAYRPDRFINFKGSFPRKFLAIGMMNENWGWLSTNILNRLFPLTAPYDSIFFIHLKGQSTGLSGIPLHKEISVLQKHYKGS